MNLVEIHCKNAFLSQDSRSTTTYSPKPEMKLKTFKQLN